MPPRAFTEPATARWLSILRNRSPEILAPVASCSAFCMEGMGLSGDSMMPLVASVSGKHLRMKGAKRARRASASAMSSSETTNWHTASVISKGRYLGLTQRVSFCSEISFRTGSCAISFAAYSLTAMENVLLSKCARVRHPAKMPASPCGIPFCEATLILRLIILHNC